MDEDFSDSSGSLFLPDDHIRSVQTNLQAQLEGFRKTSPDVNFIESQNVCENVKDKILNSEDESQLSKIHNNSRRISIASELFIGICSIYSFIVDCEFTRIIDVLIQWKKYDYISKKITHKMRLELKREKYFEKEAQSKLQKSIQVNERPLEGPEEIQKPAEETEPAARDAVTQDEGRPQGEQERVEAAEVTQIDEINKEMGQVPEHITRDEISTTVGHITVMRAESPADPSLIDLPSAWPETEMHSLMTSIPEIPIQETSLQEKGEADINQILQILEGDIVERQLDKMAVPETFLETTVPVVEEPAENITAEKSPPTQRDDQMDQLDIEEWELPKVEPEKTPKKKHQHVIIDKTITIHNYSERALYLNSNIKIQRVQVFEGPPKILQAMSAGHLMRTSGFKSSLFQDVRSSKLSNLYERHLMIEKKPVETILVPQTRAVDDLQEIRFPRIGPSEEQVEEIAARAGMYSLPRGDVLVETEKEKTLEQTEISAIGVQPKESLIGMPISRIVSPTAAPAPPDLDRINTLAVSYTPRVQQLQGQSLDPEPHSSWFQSTKKNPPNGKYREFNYVYNKVQEYWALFEVQGMKKSITLREFFTFEVDANVANFLTVLRILDKLSIQRKLFLKYQDQEVVIQPFERPFVTEKQMQIKGKEPVL